MTKDETGRFPRLKNRLAPGSHFEVTPSLLTALAARGIAATPEAALDAFKEIARAKDPSTFIALLKELGLLSKDYQHEPAPAPERPYRAYELSKQEQRYLELRLRLPDGTESYSNAMLTGIHTDWQWGKSIMLEYGKSREGLLMMVTMTGENLFEVYRAIKEWRAEWIAEFDPEEYATPTDKDAPLIQQISIIKTKPERPSLPAVEKHH